jgi:hypothetical protein
MRFAAVILCSALATACASSRPFWDCVTPLIQVSALPQLGETLADPGPTCTRELVSPSQMWPSYDADVDGVRYTLGVDGERRVHYVATHDRAFRTPEGWKTGDLAPEGTVRREAGWGDFVALASGWNAFIGNDGRIVFFFRRD